MKKSLLWIVIIVIAIFGFAIVKDQVIKSVVTVVATEVTGAPVHMDGLSLGVFSQSVRITGFKMYNPPGFSRDILIDLPKISVACDIGALAKGKLHIPNVEIELKELGLEKNKEGKLNADSLKVVEEGKKQGGKQPEKPAPQMPLQIDSLKLGIGKVVYKDYSAGTTPSVQVYDIAIQKNYKNITSAQQLVALILAEPMKAAGIQGAKIYGVAMLAGVAVLPVAIVANFVAKDSAAQEFTAGFDEAYETSIAVLKGMGRIEREDKAAGVITANINGANVTVKLEKSADNKTQVIASARKYLLPKPEIAGGVVFEISKKMK
jgi:uncharacterized protein involved in outer membrane biogenesis